MTMNAEKSDTAPPATETPLRRNRDYVLLTSGEFFSTLGSAAGSFALPLVVLTLTGSPIAATVVVSAAMAGSLIGSIFSSGFIDRVDRRITLATSLASRAVLWGVLAVFFLYDWANIAAIAALSLTSGFMTSCYQAGEMGAIKSLVRSSQLPQAISVLEARGATASLLGAPSGAFMLALGKSVPAVVNALTFAVSLFGLLMVRASLAVTSASPRSSFLGEIKDGIAYVKSRDVFVVVIGATTVLNLVTNGFILAYALFLQHAHEPTWKIGVFQAAVAASLLAGSFLAPYLVAKARIGVLLLLSPLARSILLMIGAATQNYVGMIVLASLAFAFAPSFNAAWGSYLAKTVPGAMQGRVSALNDVVTTAAMPIAPLAAGVLLANLAGPLALVSMASVGILVAVVLAVSPAIRSLPVLGHVAEAE